ncbi:MULTISPECIES: hypothetical protein [Methylotenera]|uniref:hypothetical protein n=1 Tax=Methylotenera TaxID=359407 RepID=UPI0003A08C01|nr:MULTISPECIES: hypothetical protein [Methylotenera]
MDETELIADSVMLGERSYVAALDLVIAQAENHLLIFDQSFEKGDYASLKRFELIQHFLAKNAQSELTIILQNAQFFSVNCPRLFDLLSIYAHKMRVYETNDFAKIAKDCFVIADKKHYCRRFHIDQARFKFALNDVETTASLLLRYDELLAETADTISVTKLGL